MSRLFYDDEFDALAQTISNSEKTFKQCAGFLFPSLKPDSQYATLKNCLNPEHERKLDFGQIIALCDFCQTFDALYFMCDELNHERGAQKNPVDEIVELQREFIKSAREMEKVAARIEQLSVPRIKVA